jgi:hypothetical protein
MKKTIKNIYSLEQLLSSFLVSEAIIDIRKERENILLDKAADKLELPNISNKRAIDLYKQFAEIIDYRNNFLTFAKIGFEHIEKYKFCDDPSVVIKATQDTNHLQKSFGSSFSIFQKVNLEEHTLNVFEKGLQIAQTKGRVMQVVIPMLGCLFHDFGKSTELRNILLGNSVGGSYKAHADVSELYIKEILIIDYQKKMPEQTPNDTINLLSTSVLNHHPSNNRHRNDTIISFIIDADTNARKIEFKKEKNKLNEN